RRRVALPQSQQFSHALILASRARCPRVDNPTVGLHQDRQYATVARVLRAGPRRPRPSTGGTTMIRRTITTTVAAGLGALALALAGCTSPAPTADAAGSTLEQLREEGSITLAIASEQPYSWVDENGEPTGATIALHERIFSELGIENIEVEEVAWDNLIPGLNAGRWDAVSAGMSILP